MSVLIEIFKCLEISRKLGVNHLPYKKLQKYNIATASNKYKADCNRRAHVGRLIDETRRRMCHQANSTSDRSIFAIRSRGIWRRVLSSKLRLFALTRLIEFDSTSPGRLMGVVVHRKLIVSRMSGCR